MTQRPWAITAGALLAGMAAVAVVLSPIDGAGGPGGVIEVHTRDAVGASMLRARGQGYYTISSAGHESNAAVALARMGFTTLVLHRDGDPVYGADHGRDLVAGIPDARLVVLPGRDHFLFSGDTDPILAAVEDFVAGGARGPAVPDRFLATVLAADLLDPAGGGAVARDLAEACAPALGRCVERHGGELAAAGRRTVAVFDGPGRAVRAACDLRQALAPLGAEVRAGVHTAEIERHGGAVAGLGVDIAARVAEVAEVGSVWVSRTVTDLVAGTGLVFEPRGEHRLAGVADPWVLYELAA